MRGTENEQKTRRNTVIVAVRRLRTNNNNKSPQMAATHHAGFVRLGFTSRTVRPLANRHAARIPCQLLGRERETPQVRCGPGTVPYRRARRLLSRPSPWNTVITASAPPTTQHRPTLACSGATSRRRARRAFCLPGFPFVTPLPLGPQSVKLYAAESEKMVHPGCWRGLGERPAPLMASFVDPVERRRQDRGRDGVAHREVPRASRLWCGSCPLSDIPPFRAAARRAGGHESREILRRRLVHRASACACAAPWRRRLTARHGGADSAHAQRRQRRRPFRLGRTFRVS